jgi:hypothetical protein
MQHVLVWDIETVPNLRARNVTPHVTQNSSVTKTGSSRESAIDGRTTHGTKAMEYRNRAAQ